jgi:hypothetical protein
MSEETFDNDPWLIAQSEEEGVPLLFRMRQSIPASVQPERYPELISILWQLENETISGMPEDEELSAIIDFEDRLDGLEGDALGYMMVAITGNGRKEWLWYVADISAFMSAVNVALSSAPLRFPIEFEASHDATWETFRALIGGAGRLQ